MGEGECLVSSHLATQKSFSCPLDLAPRNPQPHNSPHGHSTERGTRAKRPAMLAGKQNNRVRAGKNPKKPLGNVKNGTPPVAIRSVFRAGRGSKNNTRMLNPRVFDRFSPKIDEIGVHFLPFLWCFSWVKKQK